MDTTLKKPFYPLFFAILPALFLGVQNYRMVAWSDPLRSMVFTLGTAAFFFVVLRGILKDWHRAALVCCALLVYFLGFGHLINLIETQTGRIFDLTGLLRMALIWTVLMLVGVFFLLRSKRAASFTPFLNAAVLAALLFNLVELAEAVIAVHLPAANEARQLAEIRNDAAAGVYASAESDESSPDIYFIILDSYEGSEALDKYYHFDNSAFLDALRERGFYVADHSRSNYLTTVYSLPATLNLTYIHDLRPDLFRRLTSSLQINFVHDFLSARGYEAVRFDTGFEITEDTPAEVVKSPVINGNLRELNEFETLMLKTTLVRVLFGTYSSVWNQGGDALLQAVRDDFNHRRERILYAFDHFADFAALDNPQYVFAHIVAPHNPYLWDAAGEERIFTGSEDLFGDQKNPEHNIELYTQQLTYINQLTLDAIDRILTEAKTPPIIILQADHGHDTFLDWTAQDARGIDLRSSILNAMYFPDGDYGDLYAEISPVNTFRVVFNRYFGTRYPLLPDHVWAHPKPGGKIEFVDACAQYAICPAQAKR